jgi:hypothetical protein
MAPAEEGSEPLRVGSLLWVKQRGFPWWPAMVTYDPAVGEYSRAKDPSKPPNQYHCQFFGVTPMRAWVSVNTGSRPWLGPQGAGPDLREQQKIQKRWQPEFPVALEQAETAYGLPNFMNRLGMFGCNFQPQGKGGSNDADDAVEEEGNASSSDESSSEEEPEEIWVQPEDPNQPKRPMSGYMHFAAAKRPELTKAQCVAIRPFYLVALALFMRCPVVTLRLLLVRAQA